MATNKDQTPPAMESSQPPTFSTPLPVNAEEDKLDWLLQINEEMYQQELKKIVSTIMPLILHVHPYSLWEKPKFQLIL